MTYKFPVRSQPTIRLSQGVVARTAGCGTGSGDRLFNSSQIMKISDTIKKLEQILEKYGDLDVCGINFRNEDDRRPPECYEIAPIVTPSPDKKTMIVQFD